MTDSSFDGPRQRAVYIISVAAELAGMHPQTLRIYERRGLLDPARTGGGSRRYSDEDIARLARIQELTNEGVNLEGAKQILLLEEEVDRLRDELATLQSEMRRLLEETHKQYRRDLVPIKKTTVIFREKKE